MAPTKALQAVQRDPLVMIQWGSQRPRDVKKVWRHHPHRTGENYHAVVSPLHRWFYYPQLQPGEAIALKTFDSDEALGRALFTLHSSFEDPTSSPTAPARESIEL